MIYIYTYIIPELTFDDDYIGNIYFQALNVHTEASESNIWLAVGEDGVALLDYTTMHPTARYPYDNIVTFGGCQVSKAFAKNRHAICC